MTTAYHTKLTTFPGRPRVRRRWPRWRSAGGSASWPTNDKEARVRPPGRRRSRSSRLVGGDRLCTRGREHSPVLLHEAGLRALGRYLTNYSGIQSGVRGCSTWTGPQPLRRHRLNHRHAVHGFGAGCQNLGCRVERRDSLRLRFLDLLGAGRLGFSRLGGRRSTARRSLLPAAKARPRSSNGRCSSTRWPA